METAPDITPDISIDIYLIVAVASISIALFCIGHFISSSFVHQRSNRILVYLLTISVLFVSYNYLVHSRLIYKTPWFFMFGRHLDILIYMLLFFYFRSFKSGSKRLLMTVHVSLLVGFIFLLVIKNPWYHFAPTAEQHHILDLFYADSRPGPVSIWRVNLFFWLKFFIPLVFLSLAGFYMIRYALPQIRHGILKNLLKISFAVLVVFVLISNWLFKVLYNWLGHSFIEWPIELLVLSFVQVVLVLYGIKTNVHGYPSSKYHGSALSSEDQHLYVAMLNDLMIKDQAYLDPDLTLNSVADKLNVNTSYLSQAINSRFNTGFSDFLNGYRVSEAKRLLRDSENDRFSLDAIAQKAGFNSKSSFYRVFRKHTGTTPSSYKRDREQE